MSEPFITSSPPDLGPLRRRDPRAVERWFLDHADAVYTFVFHRIGRDAELAAEVVQETFLTALRKIDRYDPDRGAMLSWLTYTARNRIRAALKRKRRYRTLGEPWDAIDRRLLAAYRSLAAEPLPDEVLEKRETAELVQMALSNLPHRYRLALTRHYCQRQSLEQIARHEGTTEGAVKSLMHRARLAFRAAFEAIAASLDERQPGRKVTS